MRLLIVPVVLATVLGLAQVRDQDARNQDADAIIKAVERYGIALMYDLTEQPVAVPSFEGIGAYEWLTMIAGANDRVLIEVDETYVLVRPERPPGSPSQGDTAEIVGLLNRLSDSQLRAALDGTLTLGDLAPSDRATLLRNMMNWSGPHTFNPASKHASELLALHARSGLGSAVKLTIGAKYTPTGQQATSFGNYDIPAMMAAHQPLEDPVATLSTAMAHRARSKMPLDFGSGVSTTIAALLQRANRQLETRYRIDGRVLDDRVFVSGGYDRQSFDSALRVLLRLRPLNEAPAVIETLDAMRQELVERVRSVATGEELIEQETITLTDLRHRNGTIADSLAPQLENSPNSRIEVNLGFMLSLHAGQPIKVGERTVILQGEEHVVSESVNSALMVLF